MPAEGRQSIGWLAMLSLCFVLLAVTELVVTLAVAPKSSGANIGAGVAAMAAVASGLAVALAIQARR